VTDTVELHPTPKGLTRAEVKARTAAGQVNILPDGPSRTVGEIIKANVITRFNILLSVLLVVILVAVQEPKDALFGIVMVSNAAIGIVQELRAKQTLDRLAVLTSPTITAIRDGQPVTTPIDQIVIGDLIELSTGDQLPVDGTVVDTSGLEIDESLLTGESDAILKEIGDEALSGSFVVAGTGRFVAEKVGTDSYAAGLASQAKKFTLVHSELRDGIDSVLRVVSWAVVPMILLLVWNGTRDNTGVVGEASFLEALRSGVAGAVGMIPQGLVLLTSVAFAVGVIRLGRRNVLVQQLPAIEGLARVDTVCFDKTGTLTEGTLVVHEIEIFDDAYDAAQVLAALAATDTHPNATIGAIGHAYPDPPPWQATAVVPFSSARKWSGATFDGLGSFLIGGPDVLAPDDETVAQRTRDGAWRGRRMLLLAHTDEGISTDVPRNVRPVALVALGDRIRPDAAETLRFFAEQGVVAKVISGDQAETVGAIAREVGIPGSHRVVDARTLPEDPAELRRIAAETTVFGRVTPQQKREILRALQADGHVVAMTGDGVNDVLALKQSDIGIAIGSGSAASRSVAELVLVDGSFATIPGVVAEGRRVISNIEQVANLFVTKTIYAIFLVLAVGLASRPFPFLPRHLTLVGSVTIGIPAFFLALAPSARRARRGFILRVARFAIPTGIAAGLATFGAYELAIGEQTPLNEARSLATLVLSAVGLFALGMVARPLVPWKRGLIWTMGMTLLLLFSTSASRAFFELTMPRPVVLMAGVGVVAIAGTVMIGTLRSVGWIKHVPRALRDNPPMAATTWTGLRKRLQLGRRAGKLIDSVRGTGTITGGVETTDTPVDQGGGQQEAEAEASDVEPEDDPLLDIQWFDPDEEYGSGGISGPEEM
jgi:cation-transporting ATPase E